MLMIGCGAKYNSKAAEAITHKVLTAANSKPNLTSAHCEYRGLSRLTQPVMRI